MPTDCTARLYIADDYMDNSATIRCQLEEGHDGPHKEAFRRESSGTVLIQWDKDEGEEAPDAD